MKQLLMFLIFVVILVFVGAFGYHIIENWSFLDSLYMTIITLSTTGFSEVFPLSAAGKIFTIVLLILGITSLGIFITILARMVIDGEFKLILGRKKLEKKISKLKNHIIICGYGRMGRHIAKGFRESNQEVIVIDIDDKVCESLLVDGFTYIKGDAKSQDVLDQAGIGRAKALIPAMSDDANNLFITLTARTINKEIKIISSIVEDENKGKFEQVGVNKLISPYYLSSTKVVNSVINPAVEDFLEISALKTNIEIQLTELNISNNSSLIGKNIIQSKMREDYGVMIVGVKKFDGRLFFPPNPMEQIEHNDSLIVVGKKEGINKVINYFL